MYNLFGKYNVLKIKVLFNVWLHSAQRLHFTTVSQGEVLKNKKRDRVYFVMKAINF